MAHRLSRNRDKQMQSRITDPGGYHEKAPDCCWQQESGEVCHDIAFLRNVVCAGVCSKMRTLRQGAGQWACMPGQGDPANPDPMCGDKNAMEWATAWMGHKEPPPNK